MKQVIGKKSYWDLIHKAIMALICSAILIVTFVITDEWAVRLVVSFVCGLGGLFLFILILIWISVPKDLVILDDATIVLPNKNAVFRLCDIRTVTNEYGTFELSVSYGALFITLKNGKTYTQRRIENVADVAKKLKELLKAE